MNEKLLYELAYTICRTIEDKKRLERENEMLKQKVKDYDDRLVQSIKDDEKFIGDLFVTMIKGVTD